MIYFIKCKCSNGFIKIGYARHVFSRISANQVGCPYDLELLRAIDGNRKEERELHLKFASAHVRGEWFSPSIELLAFIGASESEDIRPHSDASYIARRMMFRRMRENIEGSLAQR